MGRTRQAYREELPEPRVSRRGRYFAVNLRRWGAGRPTIRNPADPGWPHKGEQAEFESVAKDWAREYIKAVVGERFRRQSGLPPKAETLKVAGERYLIHRGRQVEMNTLKTDRVSLNHLAALVGENRRTDRITGHEMQRWFDERLDEGYRPSTLMRYRFALGAFFDWLGGANPVDGIKLPALDERDARPWSDVELAVLRKAADELGRDYRTYLELGVCTGGRYFELLALEWSDLDPVRHTVRFRRQAVTESVERTKGLKSNQNRTAKVLPEFWAFYDPNATGRITTLRRPLNRVLARAKLKEPAISNHAMRHTYARICRDRGISLDILRDYLGHASVTTTEREYGWMGEGVALAVGERLLYGT